MEIATTDNKQRESSVDSVNYFVTMSWVPSVSRSAVIGKTAVASVDLLYFAPALRTLDLAIISFFAEICVEFQIVFAQLR
jgi:hypothetical protein